MFILCRSFVTPRALSYFYKTEDRTFMSKRTDKGNYTLCSTGRKELWSVREENSEGNVLVDGSRVGEVVCTVPRKQTLVIREQESGM